MELEVRSREIVLRPPDLWDKVRGCCKGSAKEAERELDEEENEWRARRSRTK